MKIMITGSSGGIGTILTEAFDSYENELMLVINRTKPYHAVKNALVQYITCDFTNFDMVKNIFNCVDIDSIINTIGRFDNSLISRMENHQWDSIITDNMKPAFLCAKFGLPCMKEGGHIINISSVVASTGMIGASNYAAAKGGIEAFTRSFALEAIRKGVFVNAISLGYFKIGMGLKLDTKIESMVKDKIPLKTFGEPEEIVKLVKYLISTRYMIGQTIHLDGGLT